MQWKSHASPLRNKNILFIGGGDQADCSQYAHLADLGAQIFISDAPGSPWPARVANKNLAGFIPFDFADPSNLERRFSAAMAATHGIPTRFDAALSIDEVHLLVAARLTKALGLSFQPLSAVEAAQDKAIMRAKLEDAGLPSAAYRSVGTEAEARAVAQDLVGRLIMKPVDGQHSHGVRLVDSPQAVVQAFREAANHAQNEGCHRVIVEEFLSGSEVDIDILMQGGEVVYSNVVDNWPIGPPWFEETAGELPSTLPAALQTKVRQYAADCVRALGFRNGLFHTEVKCTPSGPRLLEINPRLGCGPCSDLHRAACGVNLVEQLCLIAAGITCDVQQQPTWHALEMHCAGIFLMAPCSGVVTCDGWVEHAIKPLVADDVNVISVSELVKRGQRVVGKREGPPDCLGIVVITTKSRSESKDVVDKLRTLLAVPIDADCGEQIGQFNIYMPEIQFHNPI